MTLYADKAKSHLSDYRRTRLGVCEVGIWKGNGKPYPHILPEKLRFFNLIETYREELRAYLEESGIQLDQGFHHLNSSQAACLNLFWPILNFGGSDLALEALGIGPDEVSTWEFEKVIEMGEHTQFDLYLELNSGAKTYIEFKYTEETFGTAKDDKQHRQKLREIYAPALRDFVVPEFLEPKKFFANYQIHRNLVYMVPERGDTVIFLLPRGNVKIAASLCEVLKSAIQKSTYRSRIKIRYLEDVVTDAFARLSKDDHNLHTYLQLYQDKYLI